MQETFLSDCGPYWRVILLEAASKDQYMDMVSSYTQAGCEVKQCSAVAKFPNVWQENIPHMITPPSTA